MEFLAVLVIIGAVLAFQNRLYKKNAFRRLEYHCRFSVSQACEGDEIELIEEFSNRKWLMLPWLKTEITTSKWLDFAGSQSVVTGDTRYVPSFFTIRGQQQLTRRWKVTCLKRGEFSIDRVTIVTTDLLGYSFLSQAGESGATLLVLPRPLEHPQLAPLPRYLTGDIFVRRQLVTDPFFINGVRPYSGREPMNTIHWNATAREQQLMVFQQEYTARQSLTVLLNIQSREYEQHEVTQKEQIENAIRVCAGVLDSTLSLGMPVQLLANGTTAPVEQWVHRMGASGSMVSQSIATGERWGKAHVEGLLQILARVQLQSTEDFGSYLTRLGPQVGSTDLILITAYLSQPMLDFAAACEEGGCQVHILLLGEVSMGVNENDPHVTRVAV